ncbi:MAG TPA: L(+)-tartrate dehydratase subunit beta [Atribacterota bacterium]|nr:L(+)-tartrate dehydratase subunit beta [Atribacterota bacterium]HPK86455.1 L(+)-tartrate dehydratase subunit beta [Atribacterota bacterium]
MKKIIKTPIKNQDIVDIKIGDIIYLDGHLITCRDVAHRRLIELGIKLPVDLLGLAIFHAGPIVKQIDGHYSIVSIGPTTSMRMEKYEKEFIEQTGVKIIVGKGGMGDRTAQACREQKALHCVFPAGCAVLAATRIEEIEGTEWTELGMPETLWICRVKEFGPLIVSIDTKGENLFENNKAIYNHRKDNLVKEISEKVKFIK